MLLLIAAKIATGPVRSIGANVTPTPASSGIILTIDGKILTIDGKILTL